MKLTYKGKFSGNVEDIPHGAHRPGAVPFREFDDPKKLSVAANIAAIVITLLAIAGYVLRSLAWGGVTFRVTTSLGFMVGAVLSLVALIPHEFLHAVCFKKEVYLYTYLEKGMLFVVGPEDMSRARFVFMSLLPNLVFGAIPYAAAMVWPSLTVLGALGAVSLGAGAGDYYNVKNALTQMPRGARTYLYGFNSWWYLPAGEGGQGATEKGSVS